MCGRLDVSNPLSHAVTMALNINFQTEDNHDLRPTQKVSTVTAINGQLQQLDTTWGIKPNWAKKLLINAQAESVAEKPTFKRAFEEHRCVVPFSGWYEWSEKEGKGKQKYLFSFDNYEPVYMAGIWYTPVTDALPELVTLTTTPIESCKPYHHRMPLLIPETAVSDWMTSPASEALGFLAVSVEPNKLNIVKAA